jgi:hypothetical protein
MRDGQLEDIRGTWAKPWVTSLLIGKRNENQD